MDVLFWLKLCYPTLFAVIIQKIIDFFMTWFCTDESYFDLLLKQILCVGIVLYLCPLSNTFHSLRCQWNKLIDFTLGVEHFRIYLTAILWNKAVLFKFRNQMFDSVCVFLRNEILQLMLLLVLLLFPWLGWFAQLSNRFIPVWKSQFRQIGIVQRT